MRRGSCRTTTSAGAASSPARLWACTARTSAATAATRTSTTSPTSRSNGSGRVAQRAREREPGLLKLLAEISQLRVVHAGGQRRQAQGGDDAGLVVPHRHRHAAHALLVLFAVQGVAL